MNRQNGAAAVGKHSYGISAVIRLLYVLMGIDAVISLILVQDGMKSFRAIAGLVVTPLLNCRLEFIHQHLGHDLRGCGR